MVRVVRSETSGAALEEAQDDRCPRRATGLQMIVVGVVVVV